MNQIYYSTGNFDNHFKIKEMNLDKYKDGTSYFECVRPYKGSAVFFKGGKYFFVYKGGAFEPSHQSGRFGESFMNTYFKPLQTNREKAIELINAAPEKEITIQEKNGVKIITIQERLITFDEVVKMGKGWVGRKCVVKNEINDVWSDEEFKLIGLDSLSDYPYELANNDDLDYFAHIKFID